MVTTLKNDNNYYLADNDGLRDDITIIDTFSRRKTSKLNIEEQANKLLQTLPKDDNHYKYIQQIAGQDNESKEKVRNIENGNNESRLIGPSPRSARELLKSYSPDSLIGIYYNPPLKKNKPMSDDVVNFIESNLNQLKAIEGESRKKGPLLSQ